eukprot:GILI01011972.1.p1 GENE.GILI01011972.1~~GILI01011972.1.p1  ORF type:complete len:216 (-),score=16.94 GILI01011972.1:63-677(-)
MDLAIDVNTTNIQGNDARYQPSRSGVPMGHGQQAQAWNDNSHWEREPPAQSPLTGYGRGDLYSAGFENRDQENAQQTDVKTRTESEIITDQLHRQGQFFPPPPPPCCPPETRRQRAELWSRSASKWDITCTIAPPPRCPLDGMDEEHQRQLQPLSLVPYKGDQWLQQSEHWFGFVQKNFKYPSENQPSLSSYAFIAEHCRADET